MTGYVGCELVNAPAHYGVHAQLPNCRHPLPVPDTSGTGKLKAIIKLQKTGYYVTRADGTGYQDIDGHGWFSKAVARDIAYNLRGMYYDSNKTTIKEVVTGYMAAE